MANISATAALSNIPPSLRTSLIGEYRKILQNYLEHRWQPSELSAGIFCEIVYTIIFHYPTGMYPSQGKKPTNFVEACRKLESVAGVPRSFQILIPRLLPALYEIRNNRGVGHAGGDVDSNQMDASAAVAMCKWTLAELIRVLHALTIAEAQAAADAVAERTIPLIWESGAIKRVLDPNVELRDQILLFVSTASSEVSLTDLTSWTESKNKGHFRKTIESLHKARLINLSIDGLRAQILPPGTAYVETLLKKLNIFK